MKKTKEVAKLRTLQGITRSNSKKNQLCLMTSKTHLNKLLEELRSPVLTLV
jgi:hypothetical protein